METDHNNILITETTKLSEILKEYPWLVEEAIKLDSRFGILKTALGRLFLKNATIGELSERAGVDPEEIIRKIREMLDSHQG